MTRLVLWLLQQWGAELAYEERELDDTPSNGEGHSVTLHGKTGPGTDSQVTETRPLCVWVCVSGPSTRNTVLITPDSQS